MSGLVETSVAIVGELSGRDLDELCDAAEAAITGGGGFGWLTPPPRQIQESYWKGVVLVPGRTLFVGRLDGVIAGSAQLFRPTRNNEAQAAACTLKSAFVAPWARGHRIARMLTEAVETTAVAEGFGMINLDVRETQTAAIAMYESLGYLYWGTHPLYARLADGTWVPGRYYYKILVGEAPERPATGDAGA
ncbi:MAG: GNAT family N-acetyltransferase [Alphaproteobacteria bacterium]|nr:GNAT family N-acetyltransferase [Alphaproteobacteria bacterium]